ncbi:hypothetical protein TNCV_528651 [Trichonephila clavipes]|nr:hypothetical protein TNCV_528651 [Trichonephila clavipes]
MSKRCTIFFGNPSFANSNRFDGFPKRERATYSSRNMDFLSPSPKWTLLCFEICLWSSRKPKELGIEAPIEIRTVSVEHGAIG